MSVIGVERDHPALVRELAADLVPGTTRAISSAASSTMPGYFASSIRRSRCVRAISVM